MMCPGLSCRLSILRWATHQLKDSNDAEDLTGEICLHCMRGRARFRGEAEFSTWLRSIALNVLKDFIKEKHRRRELVGSDVNESETKAFRNWETVNESSGPEIQWLREAMGRLPPRQKQLIEWKYGDGLTYDEIAARLSTTPAAVSQALHRARLTLKRTIEEEDQPRQ